MKLVNVKSQQTGLPKLHPSIQICNVNLPRTHTYDLHRYCSFDFTFLDNITFQTTFLDNDTFRTTFLDNDTFRNTFLDNDTFRTDHPKEHSTDDTTHLTETVY